MDCFIFRFDYDPARHSQLVGMNLPMHVSVVDLPTSGRRVLECETDDQEVAAILMLAGGDCIYRS